MSALRQAIGAAYPLREQIRALVVEMHRMRPTRRPVTLEQQVAWQRFARAMGDDMYCMERASIIEIADAVVDLIAGAKQGPRRPATARTTENA